MQFLTHLVGGWLVLDVTVTEHVFERHLGDVVLLLVRDVLTVRLFQPLLGNYNEYKS